MNNKIVRCFVLAVLVIFTAGSGFAQGIPTLPQKHKPGSTKPKPKPGKNNDKPVVLMKESLIVEDSDRYAQFSMDAAGGIKKLRIMTNQGVPVVESLPSWLKLVSSSTEQMTFECLPNMTLSARDADFYIKAPSNSVKVHVKQPTGYIAINKCEFINIDDYSETISGPGPRLRAGDIRFLTPMLTYDGPGKEQKKTIYVKIFKPDGKLISSPDAPIGYSYKDEVTFLPGKHQTMNLLGFGRPSQNIYGTGTVRVEVYSDDKLIASGAVELY